MTHDKFCNYNDDENWACDCSWILLIRADEREEVIDRQRIAMFADFRTNANGKLVLYWETAEAAARGKELQ